MEFKWNVSGWRLVAMMPVVGDYELTWIMAVNNGKYVVSQYREGQPEWIQGHYFENRSRALGYWMTTTIENTPVTDVDCHPRLTINVVKLSKVVKSINSKLEW